MNLEFSTLATLNLYCKTASLHLTLPFMCLKEYECQPKLRISDSIHAPVHLFHDDNSLKLLI